MNKASRLMAGPLGPLGLLVGLVCGLIATPSAQAQQNYKLLYSFSCGADGGEPNGPLVGDSAGNLYGTTLGGGANGLGTVFKISASGAETVLHSFAGFPTDGKWPLAGLVRDAAGNLYGTTQVGGGFDLGTVFEVSASGTETVLHSFAGALDDGANPVAPLVRDNAGNLYGTTLNGGFGGGTVFGLTPAGAESVIYNFSGPNGENPSGDLVRDAAGNLYGTTPTGGAFGQGIVFKIAKGSKETILHSFAGPDGSSPQAGLILDKAGNLYGTTGDGGDAVNGATGVVFKLDPTGTETVLFTFSVFPGGNNVGYGPSADLVEDGAGNLYGTTQFGGSSTCFGDGCGVVFEVNPTTGQENILHNFSGPPEDGQDPSAGLFAQAGKLYGTTQIGGASFCGTVFGVKPVIATDADSR